MNFARTIGLACLVLLVAGCGQPQRPSYEEDLAAITEFNARYLGAINDEDIATLSSLTTEGHVILIPNREPIVGKAANDAANGSAFERFTFDETWTPVETVIDGDLAFQRGTFTTIAIPRGDGERLEVSGSFMRIYQRQPNGEWRMTRDMFNSSAPVTRNLDDQ
ncbi:MAG TPA: nuclear transport factor 2 family protein [Gammaproteobacteria bacterium]|nr:nuclear transport factor 2 family protein [Gammaproteobacteria bacterium]